MKTRAATALLCLAVAAGAFVAGWWQGAAGAQEKRAGSVLVTASAMTQEFNAPRAGWDARWRGAAPARREVMLQAWMERDPRAALLFLLSLPPGSMAGQAEMERQALLAWSRRDPPAAYVFAARHDGFETDHLLDEAFKSDPEAALRMLESRVYRDSCYGAGNDWINSDPANASRRLAALPSGLKQGSLLQAAFKAWGKQDAEAALAFAVTLPEGRAAEAIGGLLSNIPEGQAAAIVLRLKDSGQQKAAVWRLMMDWGRRDAGAALAWSAENLPPDSLRHAMGCFAINVMDNNSGFANQTRAETLASLSPAAWLALEQEVSSDKAGGYAAAAPDWFFPRLLPKLEGSTASLAEWTESGKPPEWFTTLPAERAAQVVSGYAARETAKGQLPSLASVPEAWRAATARGMIEHMAAAGVPSGAPPLPVAERALLRAQLPAAEASAPHLEALRRWLE